VAVQPARPERLRRCAEIDIAGERPLRIAAEVEPARPVGDELGLRLRLRLVRFGSWRLWVADGDALQRCVKLSGGVVAPRDEDHRERTARGEDRNSGEDKEDSSAHYRGRRVRPR